jgi:hypothetical protein
MQVDPSMKLIEPRRYLAIFTNSLFMGYYDATPTSGTERARTREQSDRKSAPESRHSFLLSRTDGDAIGVAK